MAAAWAEPGADPAAGGVRFFCTAGRGLEPFLMREVHARLEATEVSRAPGPNRVPEPRIPLSRQSGAQARVSPGHPIPAGIVAPTQVLR